MRWISVLSLLIFTNCTNSITTTREYKIAIKELAHNRGKENLKRISQEEIKKHKLLVGKYDTIRLLQKNNKTFGIKSIVENKIFVYQFNNSGIRERIECDSTWKIISITYLTEEY